MYRVSLKENYRWPSVQVAGREFTKKMIEVGDANINDEILNSPLLEVDYKPDKPDKPDKPKAKPKPKPKPADGA